MSEVTEEKKKGCLASFPENTVYVCEREGKIVRVTSSDYYANFGKCYDDCTKALNKDRSDSDTTYREKQDADLYQVTRMYELLLEQTKDIRKSDIADRLREAVWDIEKVIEDLEGE